MDGYSPEARAIIQAARHADDPSGRQMRRVGRALALRLGVGTSVVLASGTAWGTYWSKVAIALVVAGACGAGAGLWWHARRAPDPTTTTTTTTMMIASAAVPEPLSPPAPLAPPAAPPIRREGSHRVAAPRRLTPTGPSLARSQLAQEIALLSTVNRQLENGQKTEALRSLDEYDRRFPAGALREESEAARTIVHCQLIGGPDAIAQARQFKARHTSSPLLTRVQNACVGFSE